MDNIDPSGGWWSEADLLVHPTPRRIMELQQMSYRDYLRSPEWREKRRIEINAAENCCNRCSHRGDRWEFHLHHKTYDRLGNEQPEDLEVLCARCHREHHGIQ